MDLTSLIVVALATWQAVEIWHHGDIFSGTRAWVQSFRAWWVDLLMCPFCSSVWAAAACAIVQLCGIPLESLRATAYARDAGRWPIPPHVAATALVMLAALAVAAAKLLLYALAASRLANLGNDLSRGCCRTPNRPAPPPEEPIRLVVELRSGEESTF